jgi:hypothetical protein
MNTAKMQRSTSIDPKPIHPSIYLEIVGDNLLVGPYTNVLEGHTDLCSLYGQRMSLMKIVYHYNY